MKSIRLLPVVIFAALALLVFKGIGLVTEGGYVLTGTDVALAAGGGGDDHGGGEPTAEGEVAAPTETVITDTSPTLGDTAPTLVTKADTSADHGAPADHAPEEAHGEPSAAPSAEAAIDPACPTDDEAAAGDGHGEAPAPPAEPDPHGDLTDRIGNALANGCPPEAVPVNEHGDAVPTVKDGTGKIVPLEMADGDDSEAALTARLSERRAELDRRETEIAMRLSLLEAAEKRLEERTQELAALEAQVSALVDEKQAAEDAGFKAVVSMYETMKPKEAAKIFDTLDMPVLLKVARAMSARKMSPILAAMSPRQAEALTTAFAATTSIDTVANTGENLSALPQIVGQ